jgi:hypothetical protein
MHPAIRSPLPSNKAQDRAISSSIIAQLLAALHGGRVAGETLRQIAARFAAAADPISAAQDTGPPLACTGVDIARGAALAVAIGVASASVAMGAVAAVEAVEPFDDTSLPPDPHAPKASNGNAIRQRMADMRQLLQQSIRTPTFDPAQGVAACDDLLEARAQPIRIRHLVDKSWGVGPTTPFRVRSNASPGARATERAQARAARAAERITDTERRLEARAGTREAEAAAREQARTARREAEQQAAARDPHSREARTPRGSGRKDVVREQRDTRGYTTLVDADRIRTLAKRGASITGLAGAFGISEDEVAAVLAAGE